MASDLNKDLNKERNRLNRIIRAKNTEIDKLNKSIANLASLESQRDQAIIQVDTLTKEKNELETFISKNASQKESLTTEIQTLNTQKSQIDTYISENTPIKINLEENINQLNSKITELKTDKTKLTQEISDTNSNLEQLKFKKEKLEGLMIDLREKYGLYSKDMKEMSKDSKSQLLTYSWSAILSIAASIILMIILLCILTKSNPFSEKLLNFFYHEPSLRFYSILTIRISISAAFIFLIIIFLNLSRGFVSQYIKARNRLTALRVADFLIGRIQSKKIQYKDDDEKMKLELERLKEQVDLLNTHIPKIMDLGSSSFDNLSKTKDPLEQLKKMKEIIN